MTDTKAEAARIRAEFKRAGFNSRAISVRCDFYSMGSSIDITAKTAAASIAWVRKVAESAELIWRCEMSGEILSGGNRYVHVRHSDEAAKVLARRHVNALESALAKLEPESTVLEPIVGTADCSVGRAGNTWGYRLWIGGQGGYHFDVSAPGTANRAHDLTAAAYRLALADPDQTTEEPPKPGPTPVAADTEAPTPPRAGAMHHNEERNGVEIRFAEKPSEELRVATLPPTATL